MLRSRTIECKTAQPFSGAKAETLRQVWQGSTMGKGGYDR